MPKLCANCSKDGALIRLIEEKGTIISKCNICGAQNIKALVCENNELTLLFKALIRYHYSEWEYNGKWGGSSIESLFYQENPVINYSSKIKEEKLEEAILVLIDKVYEEYDEGVTLYAGYDEHAQPLGILESIKTEFHSTLSEIGFELRRRNHFLVIDKGIELVKEHLSTIESKIYVGSTFYRARVGYQKEGIATEGWQRERLYQPYEDSDICAPPPLKATPGRMNRDGVSFLYLSTNLETAVSEVRPHPGQILSVGQLSSKEELRIADFNSIDIYNYFLSDELLDSYVILNSINTAFSLPVPPNQLHNYSLTQILSDIVRQLGYDGIAYKSSVGSGSNLMVFNPDLFEYVDGSAISIKVEKIECSFSKLPNMKDNQDCLEIRDGKPVF